MQPPPVVDDDEDDDDTDAVSSVVSDDGDSNDGDSGDGDDCTDRDSPQAREKMKRALRREFKQVAKADLASYTKRLEKLVESGKITRAVANARLKNKAVNEGLACGLDCGKLACRLFPSMMGKSVIRVPICGPCAPDAETGDLNVANFLKKRAANEAEQAAKRKAAKAAKAAAPAAAKKPRTVA